MVACALIQIGGNRVRSFLGIHCPPKPVLLSELRDSEGPSSPYKNVSEEQHWGLSSGLHTHGQVHLRTHVYLYTAEHTCTNTKFTLDSGKNTFPIEYRSLHVFTNERVKFLAQITVNFPSGVLRTSMKCGRVIICGRVSLQL